MQRVTKPPDANPTILSEWTYNARGEQLTRGADDYFAWNAGGKLIAYKKDDGTNILKHTLYLYDAGGNRLKKIYIRGNDSYTTSIYIDGAFEYHYKKDSAGTLLAEKNEIKIGGYATLRIDNITFPDENAIPLLTYTLSDPVGSTTATLNNLGDIMFREEYYPYGETAFGSYSKKRYRFAGKELDESTGLYHFGARYYRPWTARFVSVDPLATTTPWESSYSYAASNPIGNMDPTGMKAQKVHGGGGGAGGGSKGGGTDPISGGAGSGGGGPPGEWYGPPGSGNEVRTDDIVIQADGNAPHPSTDNYSKIDNTAVAMPPPPLPQPKFNLFSNIPEGKRPGLYNYEQFSAVDAYSGHSANGGHPTLEYFNGQLQLPDTKPSGDGLHAALDIIGMIPGAGEVADFTNAGLYFQEGDQVSGYFSLAAGLIPVGGQLATLGKRAFFKTASKLSKNRAAYLRRVRKAQKTGRFTEDAVFPVSSDYPGISDYAPRYKKFNPLNDDSNIHVHHVFPQKFKPDFVEAGINIHDPFNLVYLERSFHLKNAHKVTLSWKKFFKDHDNPTRTMIYNHALEVEIEIHNVEPHFKAFLN